MVWENHFSGEKTDVYMLQFFKGIASPRSERDAETQVSLRS